MGASPITSISTDSIRTEPALIEVVAHDRPRDHERCAAAERLKKAERDQRVDALGSRAAERRDA